MTPRLPSTFVRTAMTELMASSLAPVGSPDTAHRPGTAPRLIVADGARDTPPTSAHYSCCTAVNEAVNDCTVHTSIYAVASAKWHAQCSFSPHGCSNRIELVWMHFKTLRGVSGGCLYHNYILRPTMQQFLVVMKCSLRVQRAHIVSDNSKANIGETSLIFLVRQKRGRVGVRTTPVGTN